MNLYSAILGSTDSPISGSILDRARFTGSISAVQTVPLLVPGFVLDNPVSPISGYILGAAEFAGALSVVIYNAPTPANSPLIKGTCSDPNARLSLVVGGVTYAPPIVNNAWRQRLPALVAGEYPAQLSATSLSGANAQVQTVIEVRDSSPSDVGDRLMPRLTSALLRGG